MPNSQYPLVSKHVIKAELGISSSKLKDWRLGKEGSPPRLTEDIHWLRVGSRKIIYNFELMRDFLHNQDNWELHEKAITHYLESLPSS